MENILAGRKSGRELDLIVYPWTDQTEAALRTLAAARAEIVPLSLEDLFASFVDRLQTTPEEPDHV